MGTANLLISVATNMTQHFTNLLVRFIWPTSADYKLFGDVLKVTTLNAGLYVKVVKLVALLVVTEDHIQHVHILQIYHIELNKRVNENK